MRHVQPVVAVVFSRVSSCNLHMVGMVFFLLLLPCLCNCIAQRIPSPPPPMRATLSHPGHLVQQQHVADGSAEQPPTGLNRRCASLHTQPIYPIIWRVCVDRTTKGFAANTAAKTAQGRFSVASEQHYFRSPLFAMLLVLSALCLALRPAVASRALSEKGNFQ